MRGLYVTPPFTWMRYNKLYWILMRFIAFECIVTLHCMHNVYSNFWDAMYSNVLNVIALHCIHYVFSNVQCTCTWCIALHPRCIHDVYSSNYWDAAPPSISSRPPAMATTHPPLDIVERLNFSFHTFMPLSTIPRNPKKISNFICHLPQSYKNSNHILTPNPTPTTRKALVCILHFH